MTTTLTGDVQGSTAQCIRIIQAGADYVRLTVPSMNDAEALAAVKQSLLRRGYSNPVIADVHFNAAIAAKVVEYADKVRINPGNYPDQESFISLLEKCRSRGVALRIGVNHGSLSEDMLNRFGDTPLGMAESAMMFLRICLERKFDQVVVSMKASNVRVMVQATRMVVKMMSEEGMNFPVHLGVTEAGEGEDGRIKSAAGIGTLLFDGIGDTIRVSLTEEPENEIPVARKLAEFITEKLKFAPLHPIAPARPLNSNSFERRISRTVGNIGGKLPPVVWDADPIPADRIHLVTASYPELSDAFIRKLSQDRTAVLLYRCSAANVQSELRWLRRKLDKAHCDVPVIFHLHLHETDREDFQLISAACLGGAFIEGFGDGIRLTNQFPLEKEIINSTAFGILQAARARLTRTEYISCPSCGRTNFNLIETLLRIKSATAHLKGLKIGVMGCIVNGPGEMADADYGYVGAGKGKITLYKSREVIKRGIPEEQAVDELISLIKGNGDWVDPVKK
jgi:(E)-4-hydroxy-3-methylbut-2-enyl-diphosphate synthase